MRRACTIVGLLIVAGVLRAQSTPRVTVDAEQFDGAWISAPRAAVFKGIPFAEPPVGALRWQPTRRRRATSGVHDATRFGHACMQPIALDGSPRADDSEDCLTLNVWTSNFAHDSAKQPVIVWIHGGANIAGSSSRPQYDGTSLSRRGVVLVSINYRVGAMGFLAHPALSREGRAHASGNYALLDILAALSWVQRNIAAFGGDSTRVTVYGQSAGANNIVHLMASPLAKGLFQRAIPQSGAPMDGLASLTKAEQFGVIFARSLGVVPDGGTRDDEVLKALRAVSAERVQQAQSVFLQTGIPQPIVDGLVLREMTAKVFDKGKQLPIPLMLGSTALEMSTLPMPGAFRTVAGYRDWIAEAFGKSRDSIFALYPAPADGDAELAARKLVTDFFFTCQTRMAARAMSKVNADAFIYIFTRVPPGDEALGASHGADIEYIFNARVPAPRREHADSVLSEAMVGYWLRFAATGNPNAAGLPSWPAYRQVDDAYQELGSAVQTRRPLGGAMCGVMEPVLRDFWRTRQ